MFTLAAEIMFMVVRLPKINFVRLRSSDKSVTYIGEKRHMTENTPPRIPPPKVLANTSLCG